MTGAAGAGTGAGRGSGRRDPKYSDSTARDLWAGAGRHIPVADASGDAPPTPVAPPPASLPAPAERSQLRRVCGGGWLRGPGGLGGGVGGRPLPAAGGQVERAVARAAPAPPPPPPAPPHR